MLGRDHHDVKWVRFSFRETSNIKDGSNVMADMAVQMLCRKLCPDESGSLHNGGSFGIGKAINGGFGMVCDGSESVDEQFGNAWDVMGGLPLWARNPHAMETSEAFNESHAGDYQITMPYV